MTTIRPASFPEDLAAVTAIFREYVMSPKVDLGFQDYEQEFAQLPGKYARPDGCILLATIEGQVVGCAALRRVDEVTCELKRVYIRPVARGQDLGRRMVQHMLHQATSVGYRRMCLDVLPEFVAAQRLYQSLGFMPAEPVSFNPVPGTRFLALELASPTP
jgi:GNAT superfamily N-acetyltransferase